MKERTIVTHFTDHCANQARVSLLAHHNRLHVLETIEIPSEHSIFKHTIYIHVPRNSILAAMWPSCPAQTHSIECPTTYSHWLKESQIKPYQNRHFLSAMMRSELIYTYTCQFLWKSISMETRDHYILYTVMTALRTRWNIHNFT